MLSNHDHLVYGKILCAQLNNAIGIYVSLNYIKENLTFIVQKASVAIR